MVVVGMTEMAVAMAMIVVADDRDGTLKGMLAHK
jgi:hypothetical protein